MIIFNRLSIKVHLGSEKIGRMVWKIIPYYKILAKIFNTKFNQKLIYGSRSEKYETQTRIKWTSEQVRRQIQVSKGRMFTLEKCSFWKSMKLWGCSLHHMGDKLWKLYLCYISQEHTNVHIPDQVTSEGSWKTVCSFSEMVSSQEKAVCVWWMTETKSVTNVHRKFHHTHAAFCWLDDILRETAAWSLISLHCHSVLVHMNLVQHVALIKLSVSLSYSKNCTHVALLIFTITFKIRTFFHRHGVYICPICVQPCNLTFIQNYYWVNKTINTDFRPSFSFNIGWANMQLTVTPTTHDNYFLLCCSMHVWKNLHCNFKKLILLLMVAIYI
jgi:hypothetical protein